MTSDEIRKGDYVLVTKWTDGDPSDAWAVGFYDHTESNLFYIVNESGTPITRQGFRRMGRITQEFGHWLLEHSSVLERTADGNTSLWDIREKDVLQGSAPTRTISTSKRMSVRMQLAAAAMQGDWAAQFDASGTDKFGNPAPCGKGYFSDLRAVGDEWQFDEAARLYFRMADAMLRVENEGKGKG